ncbi:hypothetical protein DAEQUDRAFT_664420 [Daedalea quercina L-15889]|uniref:BTB domain-containing protein n=1 Tax=Daedalea quercina L-15889 TaxID=1314783 RepID=A0A165SS54_9APHY|nr:hypothetical protein DAEQUDRAFT_664420 [Daedalea quercina L-15889]
MSVSTIPTDVPLLPPYHEEFYFEDGNLTLLVEDTLFRVFRSSFTRHSAVWRELFDLPHPTNEPMEGSGDEHPLILYGISKFELERLLWIIYPADFGACKARTQDDWTAILDLATRWEFDDVRALAICELQKLSIDPVDRIVLSRKFDISGRWTLAAYAALCQRADALSLEEARQLGLETTVRIARLREQIHRGALVCSKRHRQAPASRQVANGVSPVSSSPSRKPGQPADARFGKPPPSGSRNVRKPLAKIAPDVYRMVADVFGVDGAVQAA